MRFRQWKVCVVALLSWQALIGQLAGAQSGDRDSVKAQLASAAPDSKVDVTFQLSSRVPLREIHELSQRLHVPLIQFSIQPAAPARLSDVSNSSGDWAGQTGEKWLRTVCNLRFTTISQWQKDVPESGMFVESWAVTAPAPIARKVLGEIEGNVARTTLVRASDEGYEQRHQSALRPVQAAVRFLPEDFNVPSGCETYVHKVKGWHADTAMTPRNTKDVLANLSAELPDQPVELRLGIASGTSVRDIAGLASAYSIPRLSLTATATATSIVTVYSLEFSSAGPSHEEQLARAECELRATRRVNAPPAAFIDMKGPGTVRATAHMKAKEATRLLSDLPTWIAGAGFRFLDTGTLEHEEQMFGSSFKEPIRPNDLGEVPENCKRYATPPPKN